MSKQKLIRITTVPTSLKTLLKGQHRFMSQNGFEVLGVAANGKELQEVASYEGIKVHPIKMTRTISPIEDFLSLIRCYKLFKKYKPTIVHSHTPKAGIVGMCAAKLAGVPIRLHTVAGLPLMEAKGLKRSVLNLVERTTYRFATKVYPNSKGLYDFIVENKFTSPQKLMVIGDGSSNGIDTSYFLSDHITIQQANDLKLILGILPNDFVYVFVGRLVGDKGINELVTTFTQIQTFHLKLLLVGPFESDLDPLQPEILKEIKNNPNIIRVGFQEDVRPFLAISDCFVFPSYREGFPNVVMQAGAMGLPSIVTNINGCNEIIIEGQNGTLVPVKNAELLKDAMIKMKEDFAWRQYLQSNSRSFIVNRYQQELVWESLLKEYKKLLPSSKFKLLRTTTVPVSLNYLLKGQLRFLKNHFEVIAVSGNDAHLQIVKDREGVAVIDVPMARKINLLFDFISLFRLYRTLKKEKPTLVHSITPKAGLLTMTAAWLARVPIRVHTFTGLVFPTQQGLMKKVLITTDKIVCKMATHVYPEGEGVKNDLVAFQITTKPLKVLANGNVNGIDTAYFAPYHFSVSDKQLLRKDWNMHLQDLVFVFIGRLVGDKGINELIAAFNNLKTSTKQTNVQLLLVGPYEHELDPLKQSTLDAIYENTNIITTGFQDDIRPFLAISDVFVFPSYREGFPNVVMQAGAMELPSIVTDINGCNEIIQHNHNGIIIPPKDTSALTLAMQQLIDEPILRQSLAQNARPSITSRYEQQVVWDALLLEYQMLLQEKGF